MIRVALAAFACLACSGCLNWQATYDDAARRDCNALIDDSARRDCLTAVAQNSSEKERQTPP